MTMRTSSAVKRYRTVESDEIDEEWMDLVYCIVLYSGRAGLLPHTLVKLGAPLLSLSSTEWTLASGRP